MKTLPFISSSLRGSIGLPDIVQPPDEAGVVSAVAPDQTGGRDVEEIIRDELVLPDDAGGVQALGPDETARQRRAGGPGDVVPLVALSKRDVGVAVESAVVRDAHAPPHAPDAPDERLRVDGLLHLEDR